MDQIANELKIHEDRGTCDRRVQGGSDDRRVPRGRAPVAGRRRTL